MMTFEEDLDRRVTRRHERDAVRFERRMRREAEVAHRVGQLIRDGRPVYYAYLTTGRYIERSSRWDVIDRLVKE